MNTPYFNRPGKPFNAMFILVLQVLPFAAGAQYSFTDMGAPGNYSQNFESFDGTANTVPANWANSFVDYIPGGFYDNTGPWNSALSTYALNQDGTGEIAFGSKVGAAGGIQMLTFSGVNNIPGGTITGFEISWDAEQYSAAGRETTLDFSFSAGGTISGTTLTTAITGSPNGNLASVIVTNRSITISGLNLGSGSNFSFTWTIATGSLLGDNAHMGLDNVSITPTGTLPVELVDFKATTAKTKTHLFWRTATEISNDFFSVERSGDGRSFSEIGKVAGAGTTFEPQDYTFTDEHPLSGVNYYRLRQVDFDDSYSYSPVVTTITGAAGEINIYPQPAGDLLNIQLQNPSEEPGAFGIFDRAGGLVLSGELPESGIKTLNISELPSGIYNIRLQVGYETTVRQFFKQ